MVIVVEIKEYKFCLRRLGENMKLIPIHIFGALEIFSSVSISFILAFIFSTLLQI